MLGSGGFAVAESVNGEDTVQQDDAQRPLLLQQRVATAAGPSLHSSPCLGALHIEDGGRSLGVDERGLTRQASHKRHGTRVAIPPWKRTYMVSIFCATAALLYADQNLMAPNLTAIAASFDFDAQQRDKYLGGYVGACFYLIGAPAALLFGYLSDTVNRRNLLFFAVVLGEGPCLLTYFVTKYWHLLVLRVLTGISLGGTFPLIFSLLSDLFEPGKRAGISAIVQVATGAGLAAGQGIAGFWGPSIGWRWPFVIVALPALLIALLMLLTTEDPPRGGTETAVQEQWAVDAAFHYSERITWTKLRCLFRIPTNVLVIAQGLPGCLPWGMLLTFMNDYLSQNKGLTVAAATTVVLAVGLGSVAGVIGGGLLGQWLYNLQKWSMPLFIGACSISGTVPLWYLVNADIKAALPLAFVVASFSGLFSSVVGPNMRMMMMNVNEPETRGMALALQTMLDDLGKGLGPALVAALISSVGRTSAFNISTAGWIPSGLLLMAGALTVVRDEAAMQGRLKSTISRLSLAGSASGPATNL